MKRSTLLTASISLALVPVVTLAATIDPSPTTPGHEVTIEGSGFGDTPGAQSFMCFNTESACLAGSDSHVAGRSDQEITFTMPTDIPIQGKILIYRSVEANGDVFAELADEVTYELAPFILDINDGEFLRTQALPGEELIVRGRGFGDYPGAGSQGGKIWIGDTTAEIVSRSSTEITFITPETERTLDGLIVQNRLGNTSDVSEFVMHGQISDDSYAPLQEHLRTIKLPQLRDDNPDLKSSGGEGVLVAVIDNGLHHNHPDLDDKLRTNQSEIPNNSKDDDNNGYVDDTHGWNFVTDSALMDITNDHGTMVAGIIAAQTDNEIGIAGIAPGVEIMPLIIMHGSQGGTIDAVVDAINYAIDNGADIINLSLGGLGLTSDYSTKYDAAIQRAFANDIIVVAAAGNGDYTQTGTPRDLDLYAVSPVCNDGGGDNNFVLGVAATDNDGAKASFSDFGSNCVDLSAPGQDIITLSHPAFTESGDPYVQGNGTSFAAPMVSAAAALLRSEYPEYDNAAIYDILISHGTSIDRLQQGEHKGKLGKLLHMDTLFTTKPDLPQMRITSVARQENSRTITINGKFLTPGAVVSLNNEELTSQRHSFTKITATVPSSITTDGEVELTLDRGYDNDAETDITLDTLSDTPVVSTEPTTASFATILSWMHDNGLTKYNTTTDFLPYNTITREQAAKFFVNFAKLQQLGFNDSLACAFQDIGIADYTLVSSIIDACGYELLKGSQGKFNPLGTLTRAEALTVVIRSLDGFLDESGEYWFTAYHERALDYGITDWTLFQLGTQITREELGELLYLANQL